MDADPAAGPRIIPVKVRSEASSEEPCSDLLSADDRMQCCPFEAAAVAEQNDVGGGEYAEEILRVPGLDGALEGLHRPPGSRSGTGDWVLGEYQRPLNPNRLDILMQSVARFPVLRTQDGADRTIGHVHRGEPSDSRHRRLRM
ncbi:hypothetical protein ACGFX2_26800 [Streptomyces goshikiensis]|uniref:hypothetical protein n=1 Tax=Streptomyces goshikiensis TaxID=1942 RepID=UPI003712360A